MLLFLVGIGPGIFAIGYTIGTGSVTTMIVAGSTYGMTLLWVLALSCLFSWVMMEAYGRYAVVTGETALFAFRRHLRGGKWLALFIIVGITFGQWNSLIGILGISANAVFEVLALFAPAAKGYEYGLVLGIAVAIIVLMYAVLWMGRYSLFERVLIFFVSLMGLSFLLSLFIVHPPVGAVLSGLVPAFPKVEGGKMLAAAFVGTTMAAATFISRPLFIRGKGWELKDLPLQRRDALWAAVLIFLISGAIMAVAMGSLHSRGLGVTKVLDMVTALEPIAGRFAIALFFTGTLAAGLSSIFPILMIAPLMVADYQAGKLDTNSRQFRLLAGVACLVGLAVPILGANPIRAQILTQVFNIFVLPAVVGGMIVLVNRSSLMGAHRAGPWLNVGMGLAFLFSCLVSYTGAVAVWENF
ncbi:MAG: divalent metal cation transporter [Bacteroidetes bacterium]|nr:MAG: divalent metal cation transporter [Bacteroidota bacterium]